MKKNILLSAVLFLFITVISFSGCNSHVSPMAVTDAVNTPTPTPKSPETCNYSRTAFWGTGGRCTSVNDPGIFLTPCGMAIDSSGDIYTTDIGNNRIVKYNSNGTQLAAWGSGGAECSDPGTGDGQFDSPFGIAIDGNGYIYVLDSYNGRVQKFDPSFNYILQWPLDGGYNHGIAVDVSGNVYIVAKETSIIQKFDQYGNIILEWGAYGSGDGEFIRPSMIAVNKSGTFVYVSDTGNNRVQKFDLNGNYLTQWGGFTAPDGIFPFDWPPTCSPFGITIDSYGDVYVCDSSNFMIKKYDENGNYINGWSTTINAWGITVDNNGTVYASGYASRFEKYTCQ
ncbi:MAG: 6-bladed beta-propeller [Candidatus Goldbacteria bacterium]|nr:6-bladed beta-propeller [Candidatus Goldiibacteriota bacterium]